MKETSDIRPSPIAGQWYPADSRRLTAQVDKYLDEARLPELTDEIVGVMAPHAGHVYSGPVAGYAFAALRSSTPDVVIVVSPMHYPYFEPMITTAHQAYATPLGVIPVHEKAVSLLSQYLKDDLGFGLTPVARDMEHSLEIELPFLQRALSKPFSLIPIMMREQNTAAASGLGRALSRLVSQDLVGFGQSAVLVASTDLSHFYTQEDARLLDAEMLRQVEAFDPAGIIRVEDQGLGFACGRGALAAVLWAAKDLGADRVRILRYATSGDVTGDFDRVVGYGAAVITRSRG
jgi:AmmeMemoRadiSam system protein B